MVWFLRRVLTSVGLIWGVATLLFLAIYMIPGDPAELLLTQAGGAAPSQQQVALLREELGLNRPVWESYLASMKGLATFDLGKSLQDGASISAEILRRLPRTLELILASMLIAAVVGVSAGIVAALNQDRPVDRAISVVSGTLISMPVFVLGSFLIIAFAQYLRVLPSGGFVPFGSDPAAHLRALVLPALTIAAGLSSSICRMTRASVLETMTSDHVKAARARGLQPRQVFSRHVLRNALVPIATVISLNAGALLGGTVLVEAVFNWPGISGFLVASVDARDYPAIIGTIFVTSSIFIFLNLATDAVTLSLDPRISRE